MRHMRSKDGFTLAEMMVASFIFLIVSTAFTAGLLTAMRTQLMASDYYKATCLARNRIQRARTLAFDNISMLAETDVTIDDDGNETSSGDFKRTTIVSNVSSVLIDLTVRVYFPMPRGGVSPEPVESNTMIAYGM